MAKSKRKNPFSIPHFNPGRRAPRRAMPTPPGRIASRRPEVCPPRSTACRSRPKHNFTMECFKSIKEARAFLDYEVPKMTDEECAANSKLIEQAKRLVQRADRRNQKRKLRRVVRGPGQPRAGVTRPVELPKPPKVVSYYEEISGPDGEIVRYKVILKDGQYNRRLRTKEDPPVGSIILDLTSGVKAWKRHSDKRRSIPLTNEMKRSYQNSFLFKVRKLAAGKMSLEEFKKAVNQVRAKTSGALSSQTGDQSKPKKLRRKNRKNR